MAEQPYRPYTDSRLYPGAHLLGTERAERLRTLRARHRITLPFMVVGVYWCHG